MKNIIEFNLDDLPEAMEGHHDILIASASYEPRARGVWGAVKTQAFSQSIVCYNANHSAYLQEHLDWFTGKIPTADVVALDSDFPLRTFDGLIGRINGLRADAPRDVVIDITAFTREALAILVFLLRNRLPSGSKVRAVYQKAKKYGKSEHGGWLSHGIREVRTVLGYSGVVKLGSETHLILLPGFELERAKEIIDAVHPAFISFGAVTLEQCVSGEIASTLEKLLGQLRALYRGAMFDQFEFSSVDPIITRDAILRLVGSGMGRNIVLACLNAKPATIGACLAAWKCPLLQMVYAQPVAYNLSEYAEPSGRFIAFDLPQD